MTGHEIEHDPNENAADAKYTVVARRYRPKTFDELVGQDTVAQALLRAIETHRVGHAYLFTGARGVGKTSTARIFAKALNASEDGSGRFDPSSDIALAIDSGEDMDVIEIDGASNRGIDEIRQLRANASIRPSRCRFKIYIIDEVHMLTTPAFNALLKTLEEPPGHVKFIFCTTDPEKIPITVLSRCQRFDFPPVRSDKILERLRFICDTEGTHADEDALRLIARRAAGSMRDSQSLLEQLLSFGGKQITVDDVHSMLGIADEARLTAFAQCLIERNASGALIELDQAMSAGVDPGQLAEQLLGYLRDMMAVSIGGPAELMRTANPNSAEQLQAAGTAWGTMTLLSAMQLLDETIVRMKHSVQSRILLEVALVQICSLQDLQTLADVIKGLATGHIPPVSSRAATAPTMAPRVTTVTASVPIANPPAESPATPQAPAVQQEPVVPKEPPIDPKKKEDVTNEALQVAPPALLDALPPNAELLDEPLHNEPLQNEAPLDAPPQNEAPLCLFQRVVGGLEGVVQQAALMAIELTVAADDRWRILLAREAKFAIDLFRKPQNADLIENALREATGREVQLEWVLTDRPLPPDAKRISAGMATPEVNSPRATAPQNEKIREAMSNPIVKRFLDLFEGQVIRVDEPAVARVPAPIMKTAAANDAEGSADSTSEVSLQAD